MTLIKSISGIRGTIGGRPYENLTPLDTVIYVSAFASWLKSNFLNIQPKVVVGRDARISGPMIQSLVNQTFVAYGIDVFDLGLSTTPTVEISVIELKAQAGIIITASHNPKDWNALKFIELRDQIRPQARIYMRMIRQEDNLDEWPSYEAYWRPKLSDNDRLYYHNIFNWGGQLKGFKSVEGSYEPGLPCVSLWSLLVIFGDGRVPLCNVDFNNVYPIGSVLEHSIEELWRSKALNDFREQHLSGKKSCISLCENCNVWDEGQITNDSISPEYSEQVALVG